MKIIYNKIIPFRGFKAINLFGVLFVRKGMYMSVCDIQHEMIHTKQMKELGCVFFYIWYVIEWLVKLCLYGKNAYYNISFEREAYKWQCAEQYLSMRKKYSFLKYL